VLSATTAGGVYLDAVCPVNAAWDEVDVELDRLRIAVARGGDEEIDTSRFADAMERVAEASSDAGKRLDTEQQSWPAQAEPAVESVRETLQADRKQALSVAKLDAEEAEARAALGLPEDPVAACAQWEEQQAETAQPERSPTPQSGSTGGGSGSERKGGDSNG
jgi:hypothetical protein